MAKGASINFRGYEETIPKLLDLLKLGTELKKYDKVVLKPHLTNSPQDSTPVQFVESVLKFVLENKNPVAEVFIAEGADGYDTEDLFDSQGYKTLAEKYPVGLVDLNNTETEEIEDAYFSRFSSIHYPKILRESFVISLPKVAQDEETTITTALSNMLGAYPSNQYSGFFSSTKNKIRKWPIKYSINDIIRCKMPEFAVADASEHGAILAGLPLEIDKQSTKFFPELHWKNVPHISLIHDEFSELEEKSEDIF